MTVNKTLDFVERVVWTFIQAFLGFMIAADLTGDVKWNKVLYGALIAAGIAAAKVVIAQNLVDQDNTGNGDLLPGAPVIEKPNP